jgi:hypothetical protein
MSRLIDADAFCDWLKEYGQEYIHGKKKISLMYIWKHIQDMPTIEPERKKGKWIVTSEFEDCRYAKCNQCKVKQLFYYNKSLTNFCPNCGADMRGEQE